MDERVLTQELNLFFYPSRDHYLLIPIKEIHRVNSFERVLWREKNSGTAGIVDPDFSLENISAALTRSSVLFLRIEVFEGTHTVAARVAFVAGINKAPLYQTSFFELPATISHLSRPPLLLFLLDRVCPSLETLFLIEWRVIRPIIFFSSRIDNAFK